ncbi:MULTISPECIES: alpha/beta fold hydrolase [unclassified Streptomyces]|uniref:alpha/beta fold hydrolase n=1 Tax=unclassified Streptomyces TaxID=2593676 RepID=UPI0008910116|nr:MULTISPECIES: alpha/beta hydrolase [unclassified Streptomyces]MDX2730400.1 alpha/beta hydrolase [Streptomyces sp. PA03-2a]MDX3769085.1 alpha/beta hydrolase [Streptomyces sp. AK08-01B]MDX3815511.1 alpha/beta hydrolase [Streptomyces sp. AK08-01A]SCX96273.1 Pimeloyl-ACP methyl ester carboxylesterase [Streptomyces sp. 136MFCol5.1]SFS41094.1 Pimeloyl-ACP methyl ester carboxylesterase [Streptomyces sp. ok210]
MPTFSAPDGTRLAYRMIGEGDPVVCLPGGPADSRYLGDLGGLSTHHRLIVLDLRGTGRSASPEDTSSYRCDRLVDDVEALREHLGLPWMDLLGHSAGTNIATQYAARYPKNVSKLALIGPSTRAVGIAITGETRRDLAQLRRNEPWFPAAFAALEAITTGEGSDPEAIAPFFYGRWDAAAQRHHAAGRPSNQEAVALFAADGAFGPESTRAALASFEAPVLLLAGECDLNSPPQSAAEFAGLFPAATLVVQPGAGHYPWLDDADRFVATTTTFLGRGSAHTSEV